MYAEYKNVPVHRVQAMSYDTDDDLYDTESLQPDNDLYDTESLQPDHDLH